MEIYHPSKAPDPGEWLSLDEFERIELVQNFHINAGKKVNKGSEKMHAIIHVVVENQIAMEVEPVAAVIAKLIRQGLDRHEALHAVGAVLSADIFTLGQGTDKSWNQPRYRKRLEKLTAKRWKKGKW